MCRNIKTLFNFDPPVTEQEMRSAALQFVRKISGYAKPSKPNEAAFARAVDEVTMASKRLLDSLETAAPKKNREEEAAKARARGAQRVARAMVLLLSLAAASAEPLVIGHRGCRALRPENTIPAFEYALAVGADILELDVVVTKDKQLVVHHDLELEGKRVHSITLAEVRAFDRGGTRSPGFLRQQLMPNVKIPTLNDVFAFAVKKNARLMVETKVDPEIDPDWFAAAIDKLIRQYRLSDRVILQSFEHRTLAAMRKLNPAVGLVLLNPARNLGDYVTPAKALGPRAIQFVNFRVIDASIVNALHAAKIQVFSGTTDDPAEWAKLRALGVDGILTDDPEGLVLHAKERARIVMSETRGAVVIEDLVYRNSFKEYDAAYRVCPVKRTAAPAILFVHWLEPSHSTSNRTQFLDESIALAQKGACSLLVSTMWAGPDWFRQRDPAKDRTATARQITRIKDALDFLLETPGIDAARLAYVGHDFGGMAGAALAGAERRVALWAFQAATPRWHEWYLLGRKLEGAEREKVVAEMAATDPIQMVAAAKGSFLFQFGTTDPYVPKPRAEEFFAAAPEPKKVLYYEAGHGLNAQSGTDRMAWLATGLALK